MSEVKAVMEEEIGFSHVVASLIKSGVPLVGHNLIYDVAYLFH